MVLQWKYAHNLLHPGFDGRAFDFSGVKDRAFNMLSERSHQLNVKMVEAGLRNHADNGTFMQEIGLQYVGV
ncbi:hypothetical protein WJX72_004423 [[Myrmecia] bisecta]|uniref:Uncharacterized protein n=1 Tax=[Myrmecia] bisecta TaxID=41462 RepID=A0AAW1Q3U2_9CHLO